MYIQPNSIAVLLTGVPLDESYDHTIKFASETAQRNYFLSKELMRVHPQTYQRHSENVIRVEALADNLYHVNYLMFQNTSFGNKWFYAFVKRVEYINNKTTELVYEIDVYQTWLFEMQVGQCFVEREHIVNDALGASLTDEGIDFGDHEIVHYKDLTGDGATIANNFYAVIASTDNAVYQEMTSDIHYDFDIHEIDPTLGGGKIILSCHYYYTPPTAGMSVLQVYFEMLALQGKQDAIVSVFLMPKHVIDNYMNGQSHDPMDDTPYYLPLTPILSYTPKNKKLYQYPYCFVEASDNCGNSNIYKYEYFEPWQIDPEEHNKIAFRIGATFSPNSEMYIYPMYYNHFGDINTKEVALDTAIISSSSPQIPFSIDSYAIWLAQNSTWINGHRVPGTEIFNAKSAVNAEVATVAGTMGAMKALGPTPLALGAGAVAGGLSIFNSVHDKLVAKERAKLLPDKYNAGTGNVNILFNKVGFTLYVKAIKADMLRRIDSYFELYGYKTNELKVPNMDSRPHWNFVKTAWANINGNIPADDIVKLKNIFNNGITFWKNPSEVGNYTLNNH